MLVSLLSFNRRCRESLLSFVDFEERFVSEAGQESDRESTCDIFFGYPMLEPNIYKFR